MTLNTRIRGLLFEVPEEYEEYVEMLRERKICKTKEEYGIFRDNIDKLSQLLTETEYEYLREHKDELDFHLNDEDSTNIRLKVFDVDTGLKIYGTVFTSLFEMNLWFEYLGINMSRL